ncbi:hypothetical protein CYCD_14420 [Tenuifilaceae bacterium CYCD]|nr:hypothetical protein CYCD_14420 [Tenuifilaceae bacterium CYCD]
MMRTFIFAIIVLGTSIMASAQRPGAPKMDSKEMVSKTISELTETIDISVDVQDSLKVVLLNFFDEMDKGREAGNRPNIQELEKNRDAKVKTLLTDEQFEAYKKFMDEHKPKGGRPSNDRMGNAPESMGQ